VSLTRVERNEYEGGSQQRAGAEWKSGEEAPPPERLRERLAEESLSQQASRSRWVVPTQRNNRKVVIAISVRR